MADCRSAGQQFWPRQSDCEFTDYFVVYYIYPNLLISYPFLCTNRSQFGSLVRMTNVRQVCLWYSAMASRTVVWYSTAVNKTHCFLQGHIIREEFGKYKKAKVDEINFLYIFLDTACEKSCRFCAARSLVTKLLGHRYVS